MKRKKFVVLGCMLILLAFAFIGCGEEENPFIGNWSGTTASGGGPGSSATINFTETTFNFNGVSTGTYTWSDNSATLVSSSSSLGFTYTVATARITGPLLTVTFSSDTVYSGVVGKFTK